MWKNVVSGVGKLKDFNSELLINRNTGENDDKGDKYPIHSPM